jgi:hypothetical protein
MWSEAWGRVFVLITDTMVFFFFLIIYIYTCVALINVVEVDVDILNETHVADGKPLTLMVK